ncbi:hypothetical protein F5Y02DRAFT_386193 [Annulohypoxylon stygium]|nr:hypothetical protein F5Y02DRAFT_386193 [Annulohypoxylon stygium]
MGPTTELIAFAGLSAVGFGIATNLVRSGYSVTGFDKYLRTNHGQIQARRGKIEPMA